MTDHKDETLPEPFWHAVVNDLSPVINKAIRREDVAIEYADKCNAEGYWHGRAEVIPLYTASTLREAIKGAKVEWTDKWSAKHSVSLPYAAELLRQLFDEWPDGVNEIEVCIKRLTAERDALRAAIEVIRGHATFVTPDDDLRVQVLNGQRLCILDTIAAMARSKEKGE